MYNLQDAFPIHAQLGLGNHAFLASPWIQLPFHQPWQMQFRIAHTHLTLILTINCSDHPHLSSSIHFVLGRRSPKHTLKHLCNTLLQGHSLLICHCKFKYLWGKNPIKFFTYYIKWEHIADRSIFLNMPSAKVANMSSSSTE